MNFVERARAILRPERFRLPASPKVVRFEVDRYIDSTDEEALEVWAILDESEPEDLRRWEHLEPLEAAIREALIEGGVDEFPYVQFVTPSEWQQVRAA